MKRILSLFLSILLLALAGCGNAPDAESEPGGADAAPAGPAVTSVPLSAGPKSVEGVCVQGEWLYALGRKDAVSPPAVLRVSPEDGSVQALPAFKSAGEGREGEYAYRLGGTLRPGAEGTLWIMEPYTIRQPAGEGEPASPGEDVHILRRLDENGGELSRLTVRDGDLAEAAGLDTLRDLLSDGEGNLYAVFRDGVAALEETGDVRFTLKPETQLHGGGDTVAAVLGDGRLAVGCQLRDREGNLFPALRAVDREAGGWSGDRYPLDDTQFHDIRGLYPGDGSVLFYYRDGDTVKAWRAGSAEPEELLLLSGQGIDCPVLSGLALLPDGRLFLAASADGYSGDSYTLYAIDLDRVAAGDGRTVLTYATLQLAGGVSRRIAAFNETDPDYRIEIMDYSQYGDVDAARTRLVTEIGAGRMPDLLDTYAIPLEKWAARDYFEDLWPWIENDPDLGREALMEKVFRAAEIGGKLYDVSAAFRIQTVAGDRSVVGDRMAWTWEDMWEALEAMPEGCVPMKRTRDDMLLDLVQVDPSRFLDRSAGTCAFDGEEFKAVLELCASYPDDTLDIPGTYDHAVYEGRVMLMPYAVTGFYFPQEARLLLHGDIAYVGMPNPWGEVGSQFSFADSVAMSAACGHKEGAWRFLRTLLLPPEAGEAEASHYTGFPTNRAAFRRMAEAAMAAEYERNEDGSFALDAAGNKVQKPHSVASMAGIADEFYFYAMTQEEYDRLMALYDATEIFIRWDPDLEPILSEAAAPFFAGDRSLEDASRTAQDRVALYLGEQA